MCSSPKSSGRFKSKQPPARSVFAVLGNAGQSRFTTVANAADERRQMKENIVATEKQTNFNPPSLKNPQKSDIRPLNGLSLKNKQLTGQPLAKKFFLIYNQCSVICF